MPFVHLDSVSFSYTSAVDVIDDVSLSLGPGWYGLVGENGAGKTTLLRLILRQLLPTSGRVVHDPAGAVVAWCPQVVDERGPLVETFGQSWEGGDAARRDRLSLDPDELDRWDSLSPGERRRWQMAAAVARHPDVLCVDEPTNHLDAQSQHLLVAELERFDGVGIIVSHDRRLLDRLTSDTLRVMGGSVRLWGGPYTTASNSWSAEESQILQERDRLRSERDRTRRRLQDRRRRLEETQRRDRSERRRAGVSDPDARSIVMKNRQEFGARAAAGAAGVDADRLQRLNNQLDDMSVTRKRGGAIQVDAEAARRPVLLSHLGPLTAGGTVLSNHLELDVGRDTRLQVTGANGAGKTTLLRSLVERAPIDADRILWLPQELAGQERRGLVESLRRRPHHELGEVMAVAARLGLDSGRVLESDDPSPGEARKLWLADGLGRRVWVAVLDEPTNHLDLPSVERLEAALADYDGALVLVTHDDHFARGLTDEELRLPDRRA